LIALLHSVSDKEVKKISQEPIRQTKIAFLGSWLYQMYILLKQKKERLRKDIMNENIVRLKNRALLLINELKSQQNVIEKLETAISYMIVDESQQNLPNMNDMLEYGHLFKTARNDLTSSIENVDKVVKMIQGKGE
jgi:hypothetical protein